MKKILFSAFILINIMLFLSYTRVSAADSKELKQIIELITGAGEKKQSGKTARAAGTKSTQASAGKKQKENDSPNSSASPDRLLLESGIQLYEAYLYDNAKITFEDLRKNYPDSPFRDASAIWLAKLYTRSNNFSEAESILNSITADSGEYPAAVFALGNLQLKKGDDKGALGFFIKLSSGFPQNELADDSLLTISEIYMKNGKGSQAIESLMRIINNYQDRETVDDAYYQLAHVFEKDIILRDLSVTRSLYKIFIKKAIKDNNPLFLNSPHLEVVEANLAALEKRYYSILTE